jgi:hypothetical protein
LCVDLTTKLIMLTLNPSILELKPHTFGDEVEIGRIVPDAIISRVDTYHGVLLTIEGIVAAYAPVSIFFFSPLVGLSHAILLCGK